MGGARIYLLPLPEAVGTHPTRMLSCCIYIASGSSFFVRIYLCDWDTSYYGQPSSRKRICTNGKKCNKLRFCCMLGKNCNFRRKVTTSAIEPRK